MEPEKLMKNLYATAKHYSQNYISPLVFRQIYRDYCKWRGLNKYRVCCSSKQYNRRMYDFDSCMVHYLLERCFWMQYGDSKVVGHLLSILFELDGHLGKIFDFRLISSNPLYRPLRLYESEDSRDFIGFDSDQYVVKSTWKSGVLSHQVFKPFDYFVEHATKSRVLFDNGRFVEQFIIYGVNRLGRGGNRFLLRHPPCAMSFKFPEILPKMLQHGLFVTAGPKDENVTKLLTGIIAIYTSSRFETIPLKFQEMGNVLLRAIESVDTSKLMKCQRVGNRSKSADKILEKVIEMNVLPNLEIRCKGPQDLQHICRHRIRKNLYDSWQLPNGIRFLPLPNRLKQYINLQLD